MSNPGLATFDQLIDRAWGDPAAEAELLRRYRQDVAILVVDFSDMVARTDAHSIVYALAIARAAEAAMTPALACRGGAIVKRVADTFFAVFERPEDALHGALDAQVALAAFNQGRSGHLCAASRNEPIYASMGLGYGPTLVIPGEDIYGAEVNKAFVLGEDTGTAGEVLASTAFIEALVSLPAGVGVHAAPARRLAVAGFDFQVVGDYRG